MQKITVLCQMVKIVTAIKDPQTTHHFENCSAVDRTSI